MHICEHFRVWTVCLDGTLQIKWTLLSYLKSILSESHFHALWYKCPQLFEPLHWSKKYSLILSGIEHHLVCLNNYRKERKNNMRHHFVLWEWQLSWQEHKETRLVCYLEKQFGAVRLSSLSSVYISIFNKYFQLHINYIHIHHILYDMWSILIYIHIQGYVQSYSLKHFEIPKI